MHLVWLLGAAIADQPEQRSLGAPMPLLLALLTVSGIPLCLRLPDSPVLSPSLSLQNPCPTNTC